MKATIRQYVPCTRRAARRLVQLNDAPWRWANGVEAALAIGLPVGLFTLLGQQPLGLQAALGSFTAMYGASLARPDRARLLPIVALGLLLAAGLGVVCASNAWLLGACLVMVSLVAGTLALSFRLGPPGPMMFVLVAAVSGHLTAPTALGGVGLPGLQLLQLMAVGCLLAYAVVVVPLLWRGGRQRRPGVGLRLALPFHWDATTAAIVLRLVVAVGIAILLSRPLGAYRAYWVILSAVAVLQSSSSRQLTSIRGVHRLAETLVGVLLFELLMLLQPSGLGVVLLLMLLQGATEVVVARNYALALLFITPIALMNTTISHPGDILVPVQGRVLDTLLGTGIALTVYWVGEGLQLLRNRKAASGHG